MSPLVDPLAQKKLQPDQFGVAPTTGVPAPTPPPAGAITGLATQMQGPSPIPAPAPATTPAPAPASTQDFLANYGYMGEMPINPFEQQALDYITEMSGGAPLQTMTPAQIFLSSLVGGEFAPQGQAFREQVYRPVEERAFTNLERAQNMLGERFAHRGGFFGGRHAIAQGEMAAQTLNPLSQILTNLNLSGFQGDIASRMEGAAGLESMGRTQQAIGGDILGNIMGGGQLLTGREGLNRAEMQQAQQRAYQDWLRARSEEMMPFNLISTLLGTQPFENIISQPQQSPWGELLGGIGQGAAAAGTAAALSSKEFKKDISEIGEEEENRIFDQMKKAPLFNYRYKFEPEETVKHIGLITEESPEELTLFDKKAVGLYEYISMLHATIKVMNRKIEKLEEGD